MDQNLTTNRRIIKLSALVLIAAFIFLIAEAISVLQSLNAPSATNLPQITVSGKGEVLATPDIATFSFSVSETGKTVKIAQDAATAKINKVMALLKDSKIDDKDIQTTNYSVNPQYSYNQIVCVRYPCPTGQQTLTGYTVSESITVKVRDVSQAGTILANIGELGVQNVYGPNFTIDNQDALADQARTKAIADAKAKADELARELGVRLVRVTSFSENGSGPIYYAAKGMGVSSMDANSVPAPEIPAGQNTTTSSVTITYEIR